MAVDGQALVVIGKSGSGKSTIALELMALGATLVGDDRLRLSLEHGKLVVRPVEEIAGLVEARGLGILHAPYVAEAQVAYVMDLDAPTAPRMPQIECRSVLGQNVPLLRPIEGPHRAPALYQLLTSGRHAP